MVAAIPGRLSLISNRPSGAVPRSSVYLCIFSFQTGAPVTVLLNATPFTPVRRNIHSPGMKKGQEAV